MAKRVAEHSALVDVKKEQPGLRERAEETLRHGERVKALVNHLGPEVVEKMLSETSMHAQFEKVKTLHAELVAEAKGAFISVPAARNAPEELLLDKYKRYIDVLKLVGRNSKFISPQDIGNLVWGTPEDISYLDNVIGTARLSTPLLAPLIGELPYPPRLELPTALTMEKAGELFMESRKLTDWVSEVPVSWARLFQALETRHPPMEVTYFKQFLVSTGRWKELRLTLEDSITITLNSDVPVSWGRLLKALETDHPKKEIESFKQSLASVGRWKEPPPLGSANLKTITETLKRMEETRPMDVVDYREKEKKAQMGPTEEQLTETWKLMKLRAGERTGGAENMNLSYLVDIAPYKTSSLQISAYAPGSKDAAFTLTCKLADGVLIVTRLHRSRSSGTELSGDWMTAALLKVEELACSGKASPIVKEIRIVDYETAAKLNPDIPPGAIHAAHDALPGRQGYTKQERPTLTLGGPAGLVEATSFWVKKVPEVELGKGMLDAG